MTARGSLEPLSIFADLAPVGILQTSLDGSVLYTNRYLRDALGFARHEDVVAVGAAGLYADTRERRHMVELLLRPGGRLEGAQIELRARTGEARHFVASAIRQSDTITSWLMDVTAQRAAEEELRESASKLKSSEQTFRALLDHGPDAILVHRRGIAVYANHKVAELLGYSQEELVGKAVLDYVHPADAELLKARLALGAAGEGPLPQVEQRYLRRDGTTVWLEVAALPIQFQGAPAVLAAARDISERKALQDKVMEADRLATVGLLAAGVAHEINNPLACVVANLDYLSEALRAQGRQGALGSAETAREIGEAIQDATASAERVRQIVLDLKTFARPDASAEASVDVRAVLESAIHQSRHEVRHRARLERELRKVPPVLASEARLGQVFVNLIVNAAQAIPEGRVQDNEIRIVCREDAGAVVVEVRDTGCGIPAPNLPRLFEPFFTTKPPGLGTGLGLSICYGILRGLGGEIHVRSEVGRGSVFEVRLPVAASTAEGVARSAGARPAPRRLHVLVVDDEPLLGRALARVLAPAHDADVVTSVRDALARLEDGARVDAILCDLMMPEMTGEDLYAAVQARFPALLDRILFMTGGTFTESGRTFLEKIPNACLSKPVARDDLLQALDGLTALRPTASRTPRSAPSLPPAPPLRP